MQATDTTADDQQHSQQTCPVCNEPLAELEQSLGDHLNDTHRTERGAGIADAGPDQQPPARAGGQR
jgi:hypothetical protein